jgi:hypothetical protein
MTKTEKVSDLTIFRNEMETTFDKFINSDLKEKELFEKEYNEFLLYYIHWGIE